jgi:hypothetical protein
MATAVRRGSPRVAAGAMRGAGESPGCTPYGILYKLILIHEGKT